MFCQKLWIVILVSALLLLGCSFSGVKSGIESEHDNGQWDGKIYKQNPEIQYDWVQAMLDSLELKGDEKILDTAVRISSGRIAAELSRKVVRGKVVGIDRSESVINQAQKKYPAERYPNLSFYQKNAEQLSYKNQFDYVTSFWALHWVENKQAVFDGIYLSLKPGGKALLYFGPDEGDQRLDHAIANVAKENYWPESVRNLQSGFSLASASEVHRMLGLSGFRIDYFKVIYRTEELPSRRDFLGWMATWLPHLSYLNEKDKVLFLNAVADEYLGWRPQGKNGEVFYDDYMLEVIVSKNKAGRSRNKFQVYD